MKKEKREIIKNNDVIVENTTTIVFVAIIILLQRVFHQVFLISSYGAPLPQKASFLAQHSSLFGLEGAVNYDYIVKNSFLLIGSKCIPNGTNSNHC